jgi:hypothetical protein
VTRPLADRLEALAARVAAASPEALITHRNWLSRQLLGLAAEARGGAPPPLATPSAGGGLARLRAALPPVEYAAWVAPCRLAEDVTTLTVSAPTALIAEWLSTRLESALHAAWPDHELVIQVGGAVTECHQ